MIGKHSRTGFVVVGVFAILAVGGLAGCGGGEDEMTAEVKAGKEVFERNCLACHTVGGGDRIGPDLAGVHERRDHDWLVKWIDDPIGMGKTDPIGQQLLAEWNNVPMSDSNLAPDQIDHVMQYMVYASQAGVETTVEEAPMELTEVQFDEAKGIYFDRCAGCHGTLRAGATGPNIQPARTVEIGTTAIKAILNHGLPGGMPPWATWASSRRTTST